MNHSTNSVQLHHSGFAQVLFSFNKRIIHPEFSSHIHFILSQMSNYTIEIVETTSATSKTKPATSLSTDPMLKHPPQAAAAANSAKKNADLNEAFVKDTQTQPASSTTASQLNNNNNKDSLFIADNLISSTATACSSIKLSTQLNECASLEFSSIHSSPTQNRVRTRCFVKITPIRKRPELAEAKRYVCSP